MFYNKNINLPTRYTIENTSDFIYRLAIPVEFYVSTFYDVCGSSRFEEVLNPSEFLSFSDNSDYVFITFDALNSNHRKSIQLFRWFNWLNLGPEKIDYVNQDSGQVALIEFAQTAMAASFSPWTHNFFNNKDFINLIEKNIIEKTKNFHSDILKKDMEFGGRLSFDKNGMMLNYFCNGLWIAGDYNNLHTHNCDVHSDQFRFFIAIVEIIKELDKKK